jgi:hypothetical protein
MSRELLSEIKQLIDEYVNCWRRGRSGISMSNMSNVYLADNFTPCEEQYLLIQHYKMHELPLDVLRKLPILLIKTHVIQSVNHDHKYLWAWVAQIINEMGEYKNSSILSDKQVLNRLNIIFRMNLLPFISLSSNFLKNNPEFYEICVNDFIISAHLAFPTLERLLRIKCKNHVTLDGRVIRSFDKYRSGDRVNKISSLLNLVQEEYNELDSALEDFYLTCREVYKNDEKDKFRFIDEWRNKLLHGEEFWPIMNAVIINLIILILLYEIPFHDYPRIRDRALKGLDSKINYEQMFKKFYPPRF